MKKLSKVLYVLLLAAIMMTTVANVCLASKPSEVVSVGEDIDAFNDIGSTVVSTIRTIGMFIAVGVLLVIGIKYMMGSAEEKAEYKKTMIPYLIGAVILFAASAFADMIFNLAQSFTNNG